MAKKTIAIAMLPVVTLILGGAPFRANEWKVKTAADHTLGENSYRVEFPLELGGEIIEMPVVKGTYEIQFDTQAGRAHLVTWEQDVGAIELLGMSTGPIRISLDPHYPVSGTYEPNGGRNEAGYVELRAGFRVDFDDSQLREIGLTSPFIMPAIETGEILEDGTLVITADGLGKLLGQPLSFQCTTTTKLTQIEFLPDSPRPRSAR
jgi:hypothetical protein